VDQRPDPKIMEETIFNYIDSVLYNKNKLNTINEGETEFNFYMVNRWCSMYSADIAQIINQTSNQYKEIFTLKQDQYNYIFNILPKVKKKRINYIKKIKNEENKEENDISSYAKLLEISEREVKEYIDFLDLNFK
jgi:Glu-tRNA(Gln) amidotransferase subunit E-like FAD-binding protein